MTTILNVLVACITLMLATACALLSPFTLDPDARRAAALTLQSYQVLQQAVLVYARLPVCTTPRVIHLCRTDTDWHRIQAAEQLATTAIAAAAPILDATQDDNGELQAALDAITNVRKALADIR
jgi:hypothetical protein